MEIERLNIPFGKIGVLMGGASSEREISLKSGKAVFQALKNAGLNVVAIDIKTENKKENIDFLKSHKLDCAFLALHGRFGEDGQIQEILEALEVPYTGSGVSASRLAMDKVAARKVFEEGGLKVPQYKVIERDSYKNSIFLRELLLPLVVKPATHGSSIGLSIVHKEDEFDQALHLAFSFDNRVIIEEYIPGREVTVGILDEKALPVIEIVPKNIFFDYEAKYKTGMTEYIVPAVLKYGIARKIQDAAIYAHKLLGCFGFSRVDMILDKNELPVILEINTIPGLTATSLLPKAAKTEGIEFKDLCLKLIELSYEKKKTQV